MAVQKSKKSRSKRDMRRSHHALKSATVSEDPATGTRHRRHHIAATAITGAARFSKSSSRNRIRPKRKPDRDSVSAAERTLHD